MKALLAPAIQGSLHQLSRSEIQRTIELAELKKSKVKLQPLPTGLNLFKELIDPKTEMPIARQTFNEVQKCCLGLWAIVYHTFRKPSKAIKALRLFLGGEHDLHGWLVRNTPVHTPTYKKGPRGTICLIPYEQFNPKGNQCFPKGDSSSGMKLKHKDNTPIEVKHKGKTGRLYWITDKSNKRYDIFHRIFGSYGPLGAVNHTEHERAMSMIDGKGYFYTEAIRNKRKEIAEIIGQNASRIGALLESGDDVDLKAEWKRSTLETLFKCLIGNVSNEHQEAVIRNSEAALKYLLRVKALSPVPNLTVLSSKNQEGERALKELDIAGLAICSERLKELENRNPESLIDWLVLSVVKLVGEEKRKDPEEVVFEASKIFLEIIGAGFLTRLDSRSNFDYLALTDDDFRQRLLGTLDQFHSNDLDGIIQEAITNEKLLEPYRAAACAALAYQPTVLFVSRNSRVVFREVEDGSEKLTGESIELSDAEVRELVEKYHLEHPLLTIKQKQEVFYPLAGYCRIGLKDNGFIKEDGGLDSRAVFNPDNFSEIDKIGRWQFAVGSRGCIGEPLALETLTWDALCMAYLLKQFPGMKIAGKAKTKFGIFMGREFKVRV